MRNVFLTIIIVVILWNIFSPKLIVTVEAIPQNNSTQTETSFR